MTSDSTFTNWRTSGESVASCWAEHQHAPDNTSRPIQIGWCILVPEPFTRHNVCCSPVNWSSGSHGRSAPKASQRRRACYGRRKRKSSLNQDFLSLCVPGGSKGCLRRPHFMRPFAPCFAGPVAGAQVYLLRRRGDHLSEERCPRNLHLRADRKLL